MNLEWSLGESATVGTVNNGNAIFTFGVLQPIGQIITGLSEPGASVFGNTIQVLPNPTYGPLDLVTQLMQSGKITYRVLNSQLATTIQNSYTVFPNKQVHALNISQVPTGIYYLSIHFEPQKGASKTGIYKIIKL